MCQRIKFIFKVKWWLNRIKAVNPDDYMPNFRSDLIDSYWGLEIFLFDINKLKNSIIPGLDTEYSVKIM